MVGGKFQVLEPKWPRSFPCHGPPNHPPDCLILMLLRTILVLCNISIYSSGYRESKSLLLFNGQRNLGRGWIHSTRGRDDMLRLRAKMRGTPARLAGTICVRRSARPCLPTKHAPTVRRMQWRRNLNAYDSWGVQVSMLMTCPHQRLNGYDAGAAHATVEGGGSKCVTTTPQSLNAL